MKPVPGQVDVVLQGCRVGTGGSLLLLLLLAPLLLLLFVVFNYEVFHGLVSRRGGGGGGSHGSGRRGGGGGRRGMGLVLLLLLALVWKRWGVFSSLARTTSFFHPPACFSDVVGAPYFVFTGRFARSARFFSAKNTYTTTYLLVPLFFSFLFAPSLAPFFFFFFFLCFPGFFFPFSPGELSSSPPGMSTSPESPPPLPALTLSQL